MIEETGLHCLLEFAFINNLEHFTCITHVSRNLTRRSASSGFERVNIYLLWRQIRIVRTQPGLFMRYLIPIYDNHCHQLTEENL